MVFFVIISLFVTLCSFFFVFFLKGSRENVQMITCSLVKFHLLKFRLLKFRLLKFCHECEPLVIVPFLAIRMEMRNKSLVKCHISGVGGGGGGGLDVANSIGKLWGHHLRQRKS